MTTEMIEQTEFLTRVEVAAMLRIHPKTLDRYYRGKDLQDYVFKRSVRFKTADVLKFIESKKPNHLG